MTKNDNNSESNQDHANMPELNCQQLDSFLVDYVDDKLSPSQRDAFETHIKLCTACVEYVEDYKTAIQLGKNAYQEQSDECEKIPEALVSAILSASKN